MEPYPPEQTGPFRFCPGCGASVTQGWQGREFRCLRCQYRFFQNVAAACGVLIQHQGQYLFLERAKAPARGLWGLPGGFVDPGEGVETALAREVFEEIGGTLTEVSFLGSYPNVYRFEGVDYHTCDLYFGALLAGPADLLTADPGEVSQLVWKSADEIDPAQLAFPSLRSLWASLRSSGISR